MERELERLQERFEEAKLRPGIFLDIDISKLLEKRAVLQNEINEINAQIERLKKSLLEISAPPELMFARQAELRRQIEELEKKLQPLRSELNRINEALKIHEENLGKIERAARKLLESRNIEATVRLLGLTEAQLRAVVEWLEKARGQLVVGSEEWIKYGRVISAINSILREKPKTEVEKPPKVPPEADVVKIVREDISLIRQEFGNLRRLIEEGIDVGPSIKRLGELLHQVNLLALTLSDDEGAVAALRVLRAEIEKFIAELPFQALSQTIENLQIKFRTLNEEFKLGIISEEEYKKALRAIGEDLKNIVVPEEAPLQLRERILGLLSDIDQALKRSLNEQLTDLRARLTEIRLRFALKLIDESEFRRALGEIRGELEQKLSLKDITQENRVEILQMLEQIDRAITKADALSNVFRRSLEQGFESTFRAIGDFIYNEFARAFNGVNSLLEIFLANLVSAFMEAFARLAIAAVLNQIFPGFGAFFGFTPRIATVGAVPISSPEAIAAANLSVVQGRINALERAVLNITLENKIENRVDTDWHKVSTGIKTANYRIKSKRV